MDIRKMFKRNLMDLRVMVWIWKEEGQQGWMTNDIDANEYGWI